jgi:dephospho-CoA kinase
MAHYVVGLTGGVASGKSTVARLFAARGIAVADADVAAREAVAAGSDGLAEVVAAFGPSVLDDAGALDRPALGRIVFGDDTARQRLESIIHPRVRTRSAELIAAAPPDAVVVNDVPLLVEKGYRVPVVIVVQAPLPVRLERLARDRGMSRAEAESRMAAQATDEQRREVADIVIDNDGTLDELRSRVDAVWADLLAARG